MRSVHPKRGFFLARIPVQCWGDFPFQWSFTPSLHCPFIQKRTSSLQDLGRNREASAQGSCAGGFVFGDRVSDDADRQRLSAKKRYQADLLQQMREREAQREAEKLRRFREDEEERIRLEREVERERVR